MARLMYGSMRTAREDGGPQQEAGDGGSRARDGGQLDVLRHESGVVRGNVDDSLAEEALAREKMTWAMRAVPRGRASA